MSLPPKLGPNLSHRVYNDCEQYAYLVTVGEMLLLCTVDKIVSVHTVVIINA